MIEPYETYQGKTRKGTEYTAELWICPICGGKKSTLIIDGEWCHGDSQGFSCGGGRPHVEGCVDCILKEGGK